jgi:hypothetical protein
MGKSEELTLSTKYRLQPGRIMIPWQNPFILYFHDPLPSTFISLIYSRVEISKTLFDEIEEIEEIDRFNSLSNNMPKYELAVGLAFITCT